MGRGRAGGEVTISYIDWDGSLVSYAFSSWDELSPENKIFGLGGVWGVALQFSRSCISFLCKKFRSGNLISLTPLKRKMPF